MAATHTIETPVLTKSMKAALIVSVLFHFFVVIAGTIGLPFISTPPPLPPQAIAVDVVDISDMPTVDKKPQPKKVPKQEDKPKKSEKTMEAPPKVEAKEPPKVAPVKKPVEKKEKTVKPKPKTPPPPSEKLDKPKEPKKPEKTEELEEAVQEDDPLTSLMRNLQDSEDFSDSADAGTADPDYVPEAPLGPTMTNSELGALSEQLRQCWQIPIGAKDVNDMVVNIRIWVGRDRIVNRAEIADQWRMGNDPAFRALAESARRAVLDPTCNPVEIPMDKYEYWKDKYIEIPFDPRYVT